MMYFIYKKKLKGGIMCLIECIIYKRLDSITQLFAYNFLITLIILDISGCL